MEPGQNRLQMWLISAAVLPGSLGLFIFGRPESLTYAPPSADSTPPTPSIGSRQVKFSQI
jgi:hypothetical protein